MRLMAALAIGFALAAAPAMAQENNALAAPIERCIRDNAAQVEAAEPDLTKAVDFLVGYVCAAPIAEERSRETLARNRQIAQQNQTDCEQRVAQRKTAATPNPVTEDCTRFTRNLATTSNIFDVFNVVSAQLKPPAAVQLAARLILDLRLAHTKSRP
jgi:hypothetical protein